MKWEDIKGFKVDSRVIWLRYLKSISSSHRNTSRSWDTQQDVPGSVQARDHGRLDKEGQLDGKRSYSGGILKGTAFADGNQ